MPYCAQPNELCFLTLQFLSSSVFFSMWLLYIGLFYYTNLKLREKALQFAPILLFLFLLYRWTKKSKLNKNPNKQPKNQNKETKHQAKQLNNNKNPNKQTKLPKSSSAI